MTNPVRLLAKLTTQSKQIDGMGFGGSVIDKLEVAGALGLPNPNTGKRISNEAYQLARFVFVDDRMCGVRVKARLNLFCQERRGNLKETTTLMISRAALEEFIAPSIKLGKDGRPEQSHLTNAEIAKRIGIAKQNYKAVHDKLFNECLQQISVWSSDALSHIDATMGE